MLQIHYCSLVILSLDPEIYYHMIDDGPKHCCIMISTKKVTEGYASKYLTDWTGPEGRLKRIFFGIGMSGFPGNAVTLGR